MVRRSPRGSVQGGQPPSRPNLGGRTASWLLRVRCARWWTLNPRSKVPFMVWTGLPRGSSETGGHGRNPSAKEGDDVGTSGVGDANETGTWGSVYDDGRFPSLINIFLHYGGLLKTIQELIRGIKARTEEEMENWGPGRIRLRASADPSEPNIFMDDQKEAEKWEHLEELRLWMKHVVGLMSDIVNNRLGRAFFVSIFRRI